MLKIEISTDNSTFEGEDKQKECSRILRKLADKLDIGFGYTGDITVFDLNGNAVGKAKLD